MSEMIEVKTSDLIGPALDWAVAKATGDNRVSLRGSSPWTSEGHQHQGGSGQGYKPSTDWSQGGPLIDRYHIQTSYNGNYFSQSPTREYWCAYVCKPSGQEERPSGGGPTALIAACRAIVAAHLGDTVQIPAALITSS